MKKTYVEPKDLNFFFGAIGLITIFIFTIFGIIWGLSIQISDLQDQINQMPRWECHIEEITEKITLNPRCIDDIFCYASTTYFNPEHDIVCEEGIEIWKEIGIIGNYGNTPKSCLITHKEEVCDIK